MKKIISYVLVFAILASGLVFAPFSFDIATANAHFTGDVLKQADTVTVTIVVKSDKGTTFKSESTEFILNK